MTKDKVLEIVNALPAEFALDYLIERLILVEKIEEGIRQSRNGETVSHEEVKRIVQSWRGQGNNRGNV